jgi:hypothetical protein
VTLASASRALAPALERPAAVGVHLLCPLGLRPAFRHCAAVDRPFLAPGQPGSPRLDDGGIDDLPAHGEITGLAKDAIEPGEQTLDGAGAGQLLAEQPDRLGIRHPVLEGQTKRSA